MSTKLKISVPEKKQYALNFCIFLISAKVLHRKVIVMEHGNQYDECLFLMCDAIPTLVFVVCPQTSQVGTGSG